MTAIGKMRKKNSFLHIAIQCHHQIVTLICSVNKWHCGSEMPGLLYDMETHNRLSGFLSFIRLVGTVYFTKHRASFDSLYGHETPVHSYNATSPSLSPIDRHKVWIHNISIVVADRIKSEEERIPTYTSLWRHWLRTCLVTNLWKHSPSPEPYDSLPPPEQCGWLKLPNCTFIINWKYSHL